MHVNENAANVHFTPLEGEMSNSTAPWAMVYPCRLQILMRVRRDELPYKHAPQNSKPSDQAARLIANYHASSDYNVHDQEVYSYIGAIEPLCCSSMFFLPSHVSLNTYWNDHLPLAVLM